jgi:hypothetical protein
MTVRWLRVAAWQNIQFRQNLALLPLPAAMIVAADNRFAMRAPHAPAVLYENIMP